MQYNSRYNFLLSADCRAELATILNSCKKVSQHWRQKTAALHNPVFQHETLRHETWLTEFETPRRTESVTDRTSRHQDFIQEVLTFLWDSITCPLAKPTYTHLQTIFYELKKIYKDYLFFVNLLAPLHWSIPENFHHLKFRKKRQCEHLNIK